MERKREIQSNIGEEITENKPGGLVRSDSPINIKTNRDRGVFYDVEMIKKELVALSEHTSQDTDLIGIPAVSSLKELNRWKFLEERDDTLRKIILALQSETSQMIVNNSGSGDYTWGQLSMMGGFLLGASLLYQRTIQEKLTIARRNSFGDRYDPLAKLLEFGNVPELSIRIGGVALQDFQKFNPKNTSPTPYYRYLLEGRLMEENIAQQTFEENQEFPKSLYPNLTKHAIFILPNRLFTIINLPPEEIHTDTNEPIIIEGGKLAIRVVEGVQEVRKKVNQTVLDPNSKDFPELSTLVAEHQESEDKSLRTLSLYIMNLDTRQRTIEAYRKARKYEREDNNGEFYMIFGDAVGEYIEEASPFMNILTNDDVSEILDSDIKLPEDAKDGPTFEELGKKVNDIFSKTSRRDFDIGVADVDWSQLHKPEEVEIKFDANRPRRFSVKVSFSNDLGESTEVECFLDTTRNVMDWNHPEDPMELPDNPDLIAFRRSILVATQSILDDVYRQAQEEYQARHAPQANATTQERRPKRERNQDPVYQLRKEARAKTQESQPEPNILSAMLSSRQEVKNTVILPSQEEFEDTARTLSHVDQAIIRQSIEEYSDKGTGAKFSRKKGRGSNGEPIYGLRIGCTVPKGARVLLREVDSETGTRKFEITDIRYRKDIYSKSRL